MALVVGPVLDHILLRTCGVKAMMPLWMGEAASEPTNNIDMLSAITRTTLYWLSAHIMLALVFILHRPLIAYAPLHVLLTPWSASSYSKLCFLLHATRIKTFPVCFLKLSSPADARPTS